MDRINSITRMTTLIFARGTNDAGKTVEGQFDVHTGEKVRGNLNVTPDEILYRAWAQTQSVTASDADLRKKWEAKKKS